SRSRARSTAPAWAPRTPRQFSDPSARPRLEPRLTSRRARSGRWESAGDSAWSRPGPTTLRHRPEPAWLSAPCLPTVSTPCSALHGHHCSTADRASAERIQRIIDLIEWVASGDHRPNDPLAHEGDGILRVLDAAVA